MRGKLTILAGALLLSTMATSVAQAEVIIRMVTGAALVLVNFAVDEITNPQLKASRKIGRIKRFLTSRGRGADVF